MEMIALKLLQTKKLQLEQESGNSSRCLYNSS